MGFRKTPKGTLIYDFDFVPKKLIPLKYEDCHYTSCYAVEGEHGERAPILVEFQGQRYPDYGFAFCIVPLDQQARLGDDTCISANIQLVATLASLFMRAGEDEEFDPWSTDTLAAKGITFPILCLDEAKKFIKEHGIPHDGYAFLSRRTM